MKHASKITLGILTVAALFGAAVLVERQFPNSIFGRFGVTNKARFRATTRFQINQTQAPDVGRIQRIATSSSLNWMDSQVEMLTARDTLLIAVRKLNLEKNWGLPAVQASDRLERMIDVEQERGTEIISLTAWSENASEAAALANGVRDAYVERRTQIEEERLRRMSLSVGSQVSLQEAAVEKARLDMLELMKKCDERHTTGADWERDLKGLTAALKVLEPLTGAQLSAAVVEMMVADSSIKTVYAEYRSGIASLESLTKSGIGPKHPKILALRESIAMQTKQLDAAVERYRQSLKTQIELTAETLEAERARAAEQENDNSPEAVAVRQTRSEYVIARNRYESELLLLNSMKEHALKWRVDEAPMKKPIEVLETAVPPAREG